MALILWQEKYSVNVQKFDDAHKVIIDYINELFDMLKRKEGNDKIQQVVDKLEIYTKTHFAEEEKAMEECGYPEIERHKEKHRLLIKDLAEFRAKKEIDSGLLNTQLLYFLRDWLKSHIAEVDQRYSEHFNSHGLN